ncbi:MAG: BrnT family toxin [Nitrospirota bacterium]
MALIFEWDKRKAKSNLSKHKVSFEEASTVFGDPLTLTIEDPLHSPRDEERFVTIGSSYHGKILVVVHCDRRDKIRIISARPAIRKERKAYEAGK